jgi:glycosyltransferase involved in cell wall biosynthesis
MVPQSYCSEIWCLEEADVVGEDLRAERYRVMELGKRRRRDFGLFFRLAALIRKERIDILHCHDELSWFYGAIGARLAGLRRIVFTVHGRRFDTSVRHLWEQNVLGRMSAAVVCVSSSLRQQMIEEIGIPRIKAIVIRNATAIESPKTQNQRQRVRKTLGIPEGTILIGSIGRLDPVKNLDLLLEASSKALRVIPDLHVILAGEGPSKEALVEKTAALGLIDRVHFLGLRKDVPDLLSAIDLYVCSSDREGISLSILEAMAAERAVIATAVGGNLELIEHDETGLLINRGDRQGLIQAIMSLSADAEKRHRLGQQGRQTVETNFSLQRMLVDYDCLYQSLLRARRNVASALSNNSQEHLSLF